MSQPEKDTPEGLRALLTQEHRELEHLYGALLDALEADARDDFIEQLRRHASREDALAYNWAQQNLPAGQRDAIRRSIAAGRAVRQRLLELGRRVKSGVTAAR